MPSDDGAMFGGFAEALAYHTPVNTELHSSTLDLSTLQVCLLLLHTYFQSSY